MTALQVILILIGARIGIKSIKKHVIRPRKLRMELKKYSNTDMVKVTDFPDELFENVDENAILDNEVYKKTYEEFGKKIVNIVNREDLDNYYRNFATIKEEPLTKGYMLKNVLARGVIIGGGYNAKENTIALETNFLSKYMNSIAHELLHAASTYHDKEKGIIYCGLSQMYLNKEDPKKNEIYGIGINEGLTQYYTNKYFIKKGTLMTSELIYKEEQVIAEALETIIGEEKTKSLYFRADLSGFVKELEQYASREDIYKFINYTDVLMYYARDKKLNFEELNKAKEFINLFLIKAYNNAIAARDLKRDYLFETPYLVKER